MKAALFTGGSGPHKRYKSLFLEGNEYYAAADSGLELALSFGILPSILVGDFDSLRSRKLFKKVATAEILEFPQDKDETDTEIGMRILWERGYSDIVIVGGGGGRLDHLLAIRSLFDRTTNRPSAWVTDKELCLLVTDHVTVHIRIGSLVSIFPVGKENRTRLLSKGLKWPLDDLSWEKGAFGISNVAMGTKIDLQAVSGSCLMIIPLKSLL